MIALDEKELAQVEEQVKIFMDKYNRGEYKLDVIPNTECDYEEHKRTRDTNAVAAFGETKLADFIRDMK